MPFICFLFLNLCSVAPRSSRGGFSSQRMGNFCRSIKKISFWIHALWMKHEDTAFDWGNYIVQLTKTIFKVFVRLLNNYSCANQLAVESFFRIGSNFFFVKRAWAYGGWMVSKFDSRYPILQQQKSKDDFESWIRKSNPSSSKLKPTLFHERRAIFEL